MLANWLVNYPVGTSLVFFVTHDSQETKWRSWYSFLTIAPADLDSASINLTLKSHKRMPLAHSNIRLTKGSDSWASTLSALRSVPLFHYFGSFSVSLEHFCSDSEMELGFAAIKRLSCWQLKSNLWFLKLYLNWSHNLTKIFMESYIVVKKTFEDLSLSII